MVARVPEKTGATVLAWGVMYKEVVQSVLLYGSDGWVVTGEMLQVLEGFRHWAAQWIMGMTAGVEWEYPLVVKAIEAAGIHPIWVYIKRQKTTIEERVACRPIYELCTEA